jgi:hypothetical protein
MNTIIEIKDSAYAKLLAKSLPRPIHSGAEHAQLTGMLLQLEITKGSALEIPGRGSANQRELAVDFTGARTDDFGIRQRSEEATDGNLREAV